MSASLRPLALAAALFIVGVITCACTTTAPTARWTIPAGLKSVDLPDGYPLAYEERGTGVPLILIHGALSDHRSWVAQMPDFSRDFRVINVNLRHYYPEPWDGKGPGFSLTEQADDIAAMIRALNLGPSHVVGHSRGGAVAFLVAARHPDVTRSIVLADATLYGLAPETPESRKADADGRAVTGRLQANFAKGDLDEAARDFVDSLSGPGTWAPRTAEQKKVFFDNIATGVAENIDKWPRFSCGDVSPLNMPVLLVNGQNSPRRFIDIAKAFRECKPGVAPIVTIQQASHIMNRQKPAEFNAAVIKFLASN